jgi:hypothetical protein
VVEKSLLPSAQAIEKGEENHTDSGGDERIQQKAEREHRHRVSEKHALCDGQHNLMEMEKDKYEPKAGDGMLRIDSRAYRRGHVTNARFCDAVHADRIVVAERVLRDADSRAEEHAAYRVAAAHTKVDRDEQRQIHQFRKAAVFVKESLQDKREKTDERDRTAIIFVNLDIRFRSGAGAQHGIHVNYAREAWRKAERSLRRDSLRSEPARRSFSASVPVA